MRKSFFITIFLFLTFTLTSYSKDYWFIHIDKYGKHTVFSEQLLIDEGGDVTHLIISHGVKVISVGGKRVTRGKKFKCVRVFLPKNANNLETKDLKVFAAMAESDHWVGLDLGGQGLAYSSLSIAYKFRDKKTKRWIVDVHFLNWASKRRKCSTRVEYYPN